MHNDILRQLQGEYEEQRMRNRDEELRRREKVFQKIPGLQQLCADREELVIGSVRGILQGLASADDLPKRMDVLNNRITSMLEKNGFPADYLSPVSRCPICQDRGYVGDTVRDMCACMRSRYFNLLYESVGLKESQEQSFATWNNDLFPDTFIKGYPMTQRQLMRMIQMQCERFADEYPNGQASNMLLMGESGLGKTFAMHAMARRMLERRLNVLMLSSYRFIDIARKSYFSNDSSELDELMQCDVLFLDDLGSEPLMDNITIVQLFNLINERQSAGKGLVLSTNLTEQDLRRRYTQRIASRLLNNRTCMVIHLAGSDVRRL